MPRKILDTTVVTTVTLKAKSKPNRITQRIIMEVTGLTLGNACKPMREAILKADKRPIKAISLTGRYLIIVDVVPDNLITLF